MYMQPIATGALTWSVLRTCVCLGIAGDSEPCKNGRTDQHAVRAADSRGSKAARVSDGVAH